MKENLKQPKGITLIALVITIIVLLILAGVSIAMLTGQNGILNQASNSKEATTQAQVEEMVSLAIGSLQTENLGDTSKITPQMVADQVNEENNRTDVTAEGSSFPTNIIFEKEGRKVKVNLDFTIGETGETGSYDGIYSEPGLEGKIAPQDLFDFEPIEGTASNTKVASTEDTTLPTKEARITGIKEEYCNAIQSSAQNTNYEIIYNGEKIADTLVIPYQVEIDGEMYKVTEVQLRAYGYDSGKGGGYSFPKVQTIIYPNTVEKIYGKGSIFAGSSYAEEVKKVVLSQNLKEIGELTFRDCSGLNELTIPSSVTSIGTKAFESCNTLTTVNYEGTMEEWNQINIGSGNTSLTNAKIICTDGTINE